MPKRIDDTGRFDDSFRHFKHKHGTYWRWIRPVFDGETHGQANARIEFRPLPAQPTVRDVVSFQAIYAGLLESLRQRDHPIELLGWEAAEGNFYESARRGLDAELTWIDGNGDPTVDSAEIFEHARDGLQLRGLSDPTIEGYLGPIRERYERRMTPARWKCETVGRAIDGGKSFDVAITEMQRRYIDRQTATLIDGTFLDWI